VTAAHVLMEETAAARLTITRVTVVGCFSTE